MSRDIGLDAVKRSLAQGSCSLDQLWQDHALLWQQLGWNLTQVRLWLGCLPNIQIQTDAHAETNYRLEGKLQAGGQSLADHLVALLEATGRRPLPLAQVLGKLPAGLVVTEAMLRAAANADSRLELKGPLVKLA